ncbi:MAG: UbiA family prenyltransferase [Cyclobacteriaceae bacterium]
MDILLRLYRTINLLSIDVAVGAVISSLCFSRLFDIKPNPYSMVTLGLTVWIIYTADRLLDVRNLKGQATTDRHKFHHRYQKQLWILIFLMGFIAAALVFFLHPSIIVTGILLAASSGLYLLIQKHLRIKEFVVAILYTIGVLLPSFGLRGSLSSELYLLSAQFFILALINLLLFSWFEQETDKSSGYSSFATAYGKKVTTYFIWMLCLCSISITTWMLIQNLFNLTTFVFLFMTFVLMVISLFPAYFTVNSRYRLLGDAVFFLPLLGLFK